MPNVGIYNPRSNYYREVIGEEIREKEKIKYTLYCLIFRVHNSGALRER